MRIAVFFLLVCTCFFPLQAVTTNSLISDHTVLQQGVPIPVWGTGRNGETVRVEFAGQVISTLVKNGKWALALKPVVAGGPFTMKVTGDQVLEIKDVLVGEVWVCSGQSNMERQLGPRPPQKPIFEWEKERDAANYPQIREYKVPITISDTAITDIHSSWVVCEPSSVKDFSAVAYFFARDLHRALNVPVGIIFTAVGGTPAEFWTSRATLEVNPDYLPIVLAYDKSLNKYPYLLADYKTKESSLLEKFKVDSAQAVLDKKPLPIKPSEPKNPLTQRHVSCFYNAMIEPLLPFAIKGVIWYQGESNNNRPRQYQTLFPAMIAEWRKNWNLGDFPFLFVQIAPYKSMSPEIREAQLISLKKTSNTAMVVTTDCGDANDIHPTFKQPVGYRLSLAARALAYKQKLEFSGPIYQSCKIKGKKMVISFTHTGKGLMAKGGDLKGFTIAGSDKVFKSATARIQGKTVVVFSDSISSPVAVRYGWENVPDINLFNKADLPASPFRTDLDSDKY